MSTTPKTEKKATYNFPKYLVSFMKEHGDITGPPVCTKCNLTYTRDKWGWFCGLCKDELTHTLWKDLAPEKKKEVEDNDKFYTFMQIKHRARNDPYSSS